MKPTIERLYALQRQRRSMLLLAMILFFASLFTLVSRWPVAYPLIAVSCVFYLLVNRLGKRRYTQAFTQALMEHAAGDRFPATGFSSSESADGLLASCGLTPDIALVPGAKAHHVLHGRLGEAPYSIGEAAFVRRRDARAVHSVAGTLVTAGGILPAQEEWVILLRDPFASFCPAEDYARGGYASLPTGEAAPAQVAVWQRQGSLPAHLSLCLSALETAANGQSAVLAAHGGSLSLFLPGVFFAPSRVDNAKPFDPAMLSSFELPGLPALAEIVRFFQTDEA